jgi:protein involved in polysaccharide export with SLBB domain
MKAMRLIMMKRRHILRTLAALMTAIVLCTPASAQTVEQLQQVRERAGQVQNSSSQGSNGISPIDITTSNTLPGADSTQQSYGDYQVSPRTGQALPGEPTIASVYPQQEPLSNPPYAANLFIGGFESERAAGLNENYLIAPGDKISVWLWGAVNYADVVTVDNQGNIFIPNIGPINLVNTPAGSVNQTVTAKIKRVYTNDVNVYVNLLTSTPVAVYVSGPVLRPGQYAGQASDSVLYFLKRAGGIDFMRGSFRKIDVVRNGNIVLSVDLYDFVIDGVMPTLPFQDGDVILVRPIGNTITVKQGARNSFTFEFLSDSLSGKDLNHFARPGNFISHASISGLREQQQYAQYVPLENIDEVSLQPGDYVEYRDDHEVNVYPINIAGSFKGASQYMVEKGTRLHEVLSHIPINQALADYKNIYLLRDSVATKQKEIIDQSLERLERSVYTAPVASTGEGSIRVQEAQLISDFIQRARQVKPLGKVIVAENGNVADVLLEPNDTIIIPAITDLIHVGGEVLMPQSLVYNDNAEISDYIAWTGGFSERANDERILIIKANGSVLFETIDNHDTRLLAAGDQIVVLPRIDAKTLQAVKDITQIIYQIAVAANAIN